MGRIVLFLTSSTNKGDGCIRTEQISAGTGQLLGGGMEEGAQEHDPGTIPIWEMVTYFQNLYEQCSTDKRFYFEIYSPPVSYSPN